MRSTSLGVAFGMTLGIALAAAPVASAQTIPFNPPTGPGTATFTCPNGGSFTATYTPDPSCTPTLPRPVVDVGCSPAGAPIATVRVVECGKITITATSKAKITIQVSNHVVVEVLNCSQCDVDIVDVGVPPASPLNVQINGGEKNDVDITGDADTVTISNSDKNDVSTSATSLLGQVLEPGEIGTLVLVDDSDKNNIDSAGGVGPINSSSDSEKNKVK